MTAASAYRHPEGAISSSRHQVAITPHDSNEITIQLKGLRFNGAGTVAMRGKDSSVDVSYAVVAGEVLDVDVAFVRATGTTATGIVGLA